MTVYRNTNTNDPFLWEVPNRFPARWNAKPEHEDSPTQCFADTPEGAWAEFVRHAEISDPEELDEVRRVLWAVEIPDNLNLAKPKLDLAVLQGDENSYTECQAEAQRLRRSSRKFDGLEAPSAALTEARVYKVNGGVKITSKPPKVIVLFGAQPKLEAYKVAVGGIPHDILPRVRHMPR